MTKKEAFECIKDIVVRYWEKEFDRTGAGNSAAMLYELKNCEFDKKEDVDFILKHSKGMFNALKQSIDILEKVDD